MTQKYSDKLAMPFLPMLCKIVVKHCCWLCQRIFHVSDNPEFPLHSTDTKYNYKLISCHIDIGFKALPFLVGINPCEPWIQISTRNFLIYHVIISHISHVLWLTIPPRKECLFNCSLSCIQTGWLGFVMKKLPQCLMGFSRLYKQTGFTEGGHSNYNTYTSHKATKKQQRRNFKWIWRETCVFPTVVFTDANCGMALCIQLKFLLRSELVFRFVYCIYVKFRNDGVW